MASIRVYLKNGRSENHKNCGYSVFRGRLYIWYPGKRKGRKPKKTYSLKSVKTWKANA